MHILYSQRGVCFTHAYLGAFSVTVIRHSNVCYMKLHFCSTQGLGSKLRGLDRSSGAWIEAGKAALSVLSDRRGGPWFSSLQATSPSSALWPVKVGVCSPCCSVHFCASPVLVMAVVPLPQNRCFCVTLLCPHHVLG